MSAQFIGKVLPEAETGASQTSFMKTLPRVSDGEIDAYRDLAKAEQRAREKAMTLLAARECPEDVKEFGRVHGIEKFAELVWMNGFQAGMRIAALQEPPR